MRPGFRAPKEERLNERCGAGQFLPDSTKREAPEWSSSLSPFSALAFFLIRLLTQERGDVESVVVFQAFLRETGRAGLVVAPLEGWDIESALVDNHA